MLTQLKYAYKFRKPALPNSIINSKSGKLKKSSACTDSAMSSYLPTASINSQALSSTCSEFVIESGGIVVEANESN